jgi:hypothetical protein
MKKRMHCFEQSLSFAYPCRYKKGSHPKGRNVFLADIEPFIKWLEEAEEEEDA